MQREQRRASRMNHFFNIALEVVEAIQEKRSVVLQSIDAAAGIDGHDGEQHAGAF